MGDTALLDASAPGHAGTSNDPDRVCPTCEVVVIDTEQIECSRCADMPRLAREIRAFKQPEGRDL